jgi:O-methyltransferase
MREAPPSPQRFSVTSLPSARAYDLYLEHLKRCLSGSLETEALRLAPPPTGMIKRAIYGLIRRRGLVLATHSTVDITKLEDGSAWPLNGLTMIGFKRLENVRYCVEQVLRDGVRGDFIEAGVWRGGTGIFMKAILAARGDGERRVWLADSFQGLPEPDRARYPADASNELWADSFLSVDLATVKENFKRYGLFDERVCFVEGWFKETLPKLRDKSFALVRLDGDLFESTMDGLVNLYPSLTPGGFMIIDDYGNSDWGCRQAVDEYRASFAIADPIHWIDWTGVYWQKTQ